MCKFTFSLFLHVTRGIFQLIIVIVTDRNVSFLLGCHGPQVTHHEDYKTSVIFYMCESYFSMSFIMQQQYQEKCFSFDSLFGDVVQLVIIDLLQWFCNQPI